MRLRTHSTTPSLVALLALLLGAASGWSGCAEEFEIPDGPFYRYGYALVHAGSIASQANAMVRTPEGKLVTVGFTESAGTVSGQDMLLARFLPDGELDASFGSAGLAVFDFGSGTEPGEEAHDFATALALLPDGGLVVAGYTERPATGERLAFISRHLADGSLDTSFDGSAGTFFQPGVLLLDLSERASEGTYAGEPSELHALAYHEEDGVSLVYAAGYATADTNASGTPSRELAVVKVTLEGDLVDGDAVTELPEFGEGGLRTVHVQEVNGAQSDDEAFALVLQPTGGASAPRVVAGGRSVLGGASDSLVVALDASGTVEETWLHDFGGNDDVRALALQPATQNGMPPAVLLGGTAQPVGDSGDLLVARLEPSLDALDESFANDGFRTLDFAGENDEGRALAVDAAGRILLAGTRQQESGITDMVVYRMTPEGTEPQMLWRRFAGASDLGRAVLADGHGNIFIAGAAHEGGLDAVGIARIIP